MSVKQFQAPPLYVGVDVSKDELVVAFFRAAAGGCTEASFSNDRRGHRRLVQRISKEGGCHRLVFESTSNYSVDLACALQRAGVPACEINPRQARSYADSLNRRAKTDRVDAAVLALAARHLDVPLWTPPTPQALELRNLLRRVSELRSIGAAEKNRLHAQQAATALGRTVQRSIQRQIKCLQRERELLLREARKLVERTPELLANFKLLLSMKGIAEFSALSILSELACSPPQLGCRQWVAWAGLDPRPRESGQRRPGRHISRMGNKYLRVALFMPALVAATRPGAIRDYYVQLLKRGKDKMLALCAVMRKMLHAIWGMLHHQQPFMPDLFCGKRP